MTQALVSHVFPDRILKRKITKSENYFLTAEVLGGRIVVIAVNMTVRPHESGQNDIKLCLRSLRLPDI